MRKTKIPNELSHSGMEIKVWSKDLVKLLYHLTERNRDGNQGLVTFGDNNFTKSFDQTLISIPECDSSLGTIVFLVGGEQPFLPSHVVCAPAINYPTSVPGCINLQNKFRPCY
jgi:hypothetical protein